MNQPFYPFTIQNEANRFKFESVGKKTIQKIVLFSATSEPNLFQLSLADILSDGSFDFLNVSNNGDFEKVMATVAQTILIFFDQNPEAILAFTGSTPERTRLYRIILVRELAQLTNRFVVKGLTDSGLEAFESNHDYIGFVIYKKEY